MKRLTIIIALLAICGEVFSQTRNYADMFDFKINNSAQISWTESQIVASLGNHQTSGGGKQLKVYWKIDDYWAIILRYAGKGDLFMKDGKMRSFEITGTGFTLNYLGNAFKVGDNISTLNAVFPTSYANRDNNHVNVGLKVVNNGSTHFLSEAILFEYDPNTNLITKIFHLF